MAIDYVRWMGVSAWTCGLAIPRHSLGLSLTPGKVPGEVSIQTAGGCSTALKVIEREHTHIQWLLGGAPRDETALFYTYHQDLCITRHALTDRTFAVVDFSDGEDSDVDFSDGDTSEDDAGDGVAEQGCLSAQDRDGSSEASLDDGLKTSLDYSPEASLAAANRFGSTPAGSVLSAHIPPWPLAEPLGLLALAVREYFSGSVVRKLTKEYARRLEENCRRENRDGGNRRVENPPQTGEDLHGATGALAYGRLAYSVASSALGPTPTPAITLHVLAEDPLFTEAALNHLIDRAQAFAVAFGSTIDCRKTFATIERHAVFPSTVHEPDAEGCPILLYKIPLCADLLPACSFPRVLTDSAVPSPADRLPRTPIVLHRDPDSGTIEARAFVPRRTLVDRSIHQGGYLTSSQVIADLQRESADADPDCLAAHATPAMIWESLATWGLSADAWAGAVEGPRATGIAVQREPSAEGCDARTAVPETPANRSEVPAPHRDAPAMDREASAVLAVHANRVSRVKDSIDRPLLTVDVDARAPLGRVVHDVCDVLDALDVGPSTDFPIELVWSTESLSAQPLSAEATGGGSQNGSAVNNPLREPHEDALPCLWTRALGVRGYAVSDQALALAAVRLALRECVPPGCAWVGVKYSRSPLSAMSPSALPAADPSSAVLPSALPDTTTDSAPSAADPLSAAQHCITAAVVFDDDGPGHGASQSADIGAGQGAVRSTDSDAVRAGLTKAMNAICGSSFPGLQIACDVIDAGHLIDVRDWATAGGYHPVAGLLPSYIQLERLSA